LQQFVWIFQKIPELVALCSENFCSQLRRDFHARDRRVFGDVANLIYFDTGLSRERGFELLREGSGLCVSGGKRTHETGKLRLS
jgi:hypothetical protein